MIEEEKKHEKRPTGLLILFVLTVLSTSIQLLSSVAGVFSGKPTATEINDIKLSNAKMVKVFKDMDATEVIDFIQKMEYITLAKLDNLQFFSFITLLISGLGLFAAIKMFTGHKLGFHLYIMYSFLSIIQIYTIVSPAEVPTIDVIFNGSFSLLFIFLYSRYLNWMQVS